MAKYNLTNKAVQDLSNIWDHTFEQWSEQQADLYYEILTSSFEEIAKNPSIGKTYDEVTENLLGLKIKKHIVFYRELSNSNIEITRILHGRIDLKSKLK